MCLDVTTESWLRKTQEEGSRRQKRWAQGLSDLTPGSPNRISSAGSKLPVSDNRPVVRLSCYLFSFYSRSTQPLFSLVFKNITALSLLHPSVSTLQSPPPRFSLQDISGFTDCLIRNEGRLTPSHTDSLKPILTRALWKPEVLNGSSRIGLIELSSSSAVTASRFKGTKAQQNASSQSSQSK